MCLCLVVGFAVGQYLFSKDVTSTGKVAVELANAKVTYWTEPDEVTALVWGTIDKSSKHAYAMDVLSLAVLDEGQFNIQNTVIGSLSAPGGFAVTVELYDPDAPRSWITMGTTDAVNYPLGAETWADILAGGPITLGPAERLSDIVAAVPGGEELWNTKYPGCLLENPTHADGALMIVVHASGNGGDFSFTVSFSFEQPAG